MKLKFELVNGFGILVDEEAEIKKGEFYYNTVNKEIFKCDGVVFKHCNKIIFAEKELNLDVPVFEWRDFEVEKKSEYANGYALYGKPLGEKYLAFKEGFTQGYKSNPAKYTEEDLREAIAFGKEQGVYYEFATQSDSREEYTKGLQKDQQEQIETFIQSLQKHPKYVVMESENYCGSPLTTERCPKCVDSCDRAYIRLKLFTNSEGKQQGVIKELIW